jgi:hypothetical protein
MLTRSVFRYIIFGSHLMSSTFVLFIDQTLSLTHSCLCFLYTFGVLVNEVVNKRLINGHTQLLNETYQTRATFIENNDGHGYRTTN